MTLIDQLCDHHKTEAWQLAPMSPNEIYTYYKTMFDSDRIIAFTSVSGEMLGFVEFTRINFKQLGSIVSSGEINPSVWDEEGPIIFVSDLYVSPKFRKNGAVGYLKEELLERNPMCSYLIGQHQTKRFKPFAVHRINKD